MLQERPAERPYREIAKIIIGALKADVGSTEILTRFLLNTFVLRKR